MDVDGGDLALGHDDAELIQARHDVACRLTFLDGGALVASVTMRLSGSSLTPSIAASRREVYAKGRIDRLDGQPFASAHRRRPLALHGEVGERGFDRADARLLDVAGGLILDRQAWPRVTSVILGV